MKLYTEEQVRQIFENLSIATGYDYNMETYCDSLTPIELPSDEEIDKEMWANVEGQSIFFPDAFRMGAKWVRDKIQGGNE